MTLLDTLLPPSRRLLDSGRLLLRASIAEAPEATEAWNLFRVRYEVRELESGPNELAAMVYANLEGSVQGPEMAILKGAYRYHWTRSRLILRGTATALDALKGEGVTPLLVHGAALACHAYSDPALRPLDCAELLLPPVSTERSVRALEAAGWRTQPNPPRGPRHSPMMLERGGGEALLLHETILWEGGIEGTSLFENAVQIQLEGRPVLTLHPADEALAAVLRTICWRGDRPGPSMTALADLAVLLRDGSIRDELAVRIRHYGLAVPAAAALGELASAGGPPQGRALAGIDSRSGRAALLEFRLRARRAGFISGHIRDWLRKRRLRSAAALSPGLGIAG